MKKFFSKLTTYFSAFVLVVALPVTIYILQNQKFNFQVNAFLNDEPRMIFVVDVKGSSAKVVWETEKEVIGSIVLTDEEGKIYVEEVSSSYHMLEVKDLQPGKEYKFSILSDGKEYTDPSYAIKTATILDETQTPSIVYGQVFNKEGTGFQAEGFVLIELQDGNIVSQKIPAVLNKAGGYQANLSGILTQNKSTMFNTNKTLQVSIEIYSEIDTDPVIKKFTLNFDTNKQIPNIYLGDVNIDSIPGINGD